VFTEYDNRGTGEVYACARCGKKVQAWLIVRNGLVFGYRCARKIALDLRDGVEEEEIWAEIDEAQKAREQLRGERKYKSIPPPSQMRKDVLEAAGIEDVETKEEIPPPEQMVKDVMEQL
jgi:hypothetical protein